MTALVLLASTTACYGVRPISSPSSYIQAENPEAVWVADDNGEVFRLEAPVVRGDSIVGSLDGLSEPFAVEMSPEHAVYARQRDPVKTATLVGGLGLVAGLAVYGFSVGGSGDKVCDNNPKQGGRPTC
jgi:hypothetical protein